MKNPEQFRGMKNLDQILSQIETMKTFNVDHRAARGRYDEVMDMLHPAFIDATVESIEQVSPTSTKIRFRADRILPPFGAGQYINVHSTAEGITASRAYTLSSHPQDREGYEITVKKTRDGYFSDLLQNAQVGDHFRLSAPAGNFYRLPFVHGTRLVFAAGGSGITPFISMLKNDRALNDHQYQVDLLYGCSDPDDILYQEELDQLEKEGFVRVHYIISQDDFVEHDNYHRGFITRELIEKLIDHPEEATWFICGPSVLYTFLEKNLKELGLTRRQIRTEVEVPSKHPSDYPGWPADLNEDTEFQITLEDGTTVPARAGETVLTALEKAGIPIQSQCHGGECSQCRTRLLDGKVLHSPHALLRKSDVEHSYIHPCSAFALSNLTLALPGKSRN